MARFNAVATGTKTTNLAGGDAFKVDKRYELAAILLTSFVKDEHYSSANDTLGRIEALMKEVPQSFAAKAAIYARNEHGMRSITHVTAAEIAKHVKGETWTRRFFDKVFRRPDDMLEVLACYQAKYGRRPIPNSLKRGIRDAFNRFDAYQCAKYRAEAKAIKLVDLVNLVHPKGAKHIGDLVKGGLKSTETWEAKLTESGKGANKENQEQVKADAWSTLLAGKKLGYLALLRNIRNIMQQAPESLDLALEQLVDEKAIRNPKAVVFPFQYLSAMTEVMKLGNPNGRKAVEAIAEAMDISLANVPRFEGKTLIALDDSGSMGSLDEPKSAFTIGALFAAALYKANDAMLCMFSDKARYHTLLPNAPVWSLVQEMGKHRTGNGTDFNCVFEKATQKFDRIVFLSDMQGWMTTGWGQAAPTKALADYKRRTGADPKIYSFDLRGYGTLMFPERSVYCLAGVSDRIFDVMKTLEQEPQALIKRIESIAL